tara:strand:+ start:7927 stop:9252 length:1326 start_codon:yes stop_codon:yes gene_type:complete
MVRYALFAAASAAFILNTNPAVAGNDIELLKQQIAAMKQDYEQRILALETGLIKAQQAAQSTTIITPLAKSNNSARRQNNFNPSISFVLDGRYTSLSNASDDYHLPGFALNDEAGLDQAGFSVGESELVISSNVDDRFYAEATLAFSGDEMSVEEVFFQTLNLADGLTLKAGRFFSDIGYLNAQHAHVWDFADAPLIYRGLFGNQLSNDGLQATYIVPSDIFFQLGLELANGDSFPAARNREGVGSWSAFINIGDDIGIEHSWQLGLNHWQAGHINQRSSEGLVDAYAFSGKSRINGIDWVYKWAPNGNPKNRHLKLQFEYFERQEKGQINLLTNTADFDGKQSGWYAQAVYKFLPAWRSALRFDSLDSDNDGSNLPLLADAGLLTYGHTPQRLSAMLEWIPSEFSRIRLQLNHDKSYNDTDNQLFLQYTFAIGSHTGHSY